MSTTIKVCTLQFERAGKFKKNVAKAKGYLEQADHPDFALIGGEFSINESRSTDSYSVFAELAQLFNCNLIIPINAIPQRFPDADRKEKGYSSMHVFGRDGTVLAIQDKRYLYSREAAWFHAGDEIRVFEIEGVKVGLIRGLDIVHPGYIQHLKGVEVLFVSTMAIDEVMLDAAKARAYENQCYVAMSSFIGHFMGADFGGNAAILQPDFVGKGYPAQTKVVQYTTQEGLIEAELDLDYVRKLKDANRSEA